MADKDAELVQLQASFDEYIESSKELELELESELSKLEDQLSESENEKEALKEVRRGGRGEARAVSLLVRRTLSSHSDCVVVLLFSHAPP